MTSLEYVTSGIVMMPLVKLIEPCTMADCASTIPDFSYPPSPLTTHHSVVCFSDRCTAHAALLSINLLHCIHLLISYIANRQNDMAITSRFPYISSNFHIKLKITICNTKNQSLREMDRYANRVVFLAILLEMEQVGTYPKITYSHTPIGLPIKPSQLATSFFHQHSGSILKCKP